MGVIGSRHGAVSIDRTASNPPLCHSRVKHDMPIRVALNHKTEYSYDRLVNLQPHVVRLRPAPHCRTPILSYSLSVEPDAHFLNWQQDPYSNYLARLVFPEPAREFSASRSIWSPR